MKNPKRNQTKTNTIIGKGRIEVKEKETQTKIVVKEKKSGLQGY